MYLKPPRETKCLGLEVKEECIKVEGHSEGLVYQHSVDIEIVEEGDLRLEPTVI